MTPWSAEEHAWARECLMAGDSPEEIAEIARRPVAEIRRAFGRLACFTPRQREVLSLYAAGCSFVEIDTARGFHGVVLGRAAGATLAHLRKRGFAIPHRVQKAA